MNIGQSIRHIRKERGLTQIQLAQKVGMAVNSIRLYESGKRLPSLDVRLLIADALECSFNELMTEEESSEVAALWEIGYWDGKRESETEVEFAIEEFERRRKDPLYANLIAAYSRLNTDGQREAVRSVEIIAGNPIFQRTETPPEAPPDAQQGNSSTEQKKPSEGQ